MSDPQMVPYIGTKQIRAIPMTLADYNTYRGWTLPAEENGDDAGYLVEYTDGGPSNHPAHEGYISWSPTNVFDAAYQPTSAMTFGHAVEMLKAGHRVARAGWNGKGMFLFLVPGSRFKVNRPPLLGIYEEGTEISYHAHIDMKTAAGDVVPWLASQTDVLAEDWGIIDTISIAPAEGTTALELATGDGTAALALATDEGTAGGPEAGTVTYDTHDVDATSQAAHTNLTQGQLA